MILRLSLLICNLAVIYAQDTVNNDTISVPSSINNDIGIFTTPIEDECCQCTNIDDTLTTTTTIRILTVGGENFGHIKEMVETDARAFEAHMNGRVSVIVDEVDSLGTMASEIRSNTELEEGQIDGFVTNPGILGTAVEAGGFMDLGKFVRESAVLDWLDVFLAFREVTTAYEGKVYMIPLDGDVLSFFYRRDILEHFNLKVPRTWDEYAEVAKAVHGKTYNGTTLSGSCVGRVEGCVGSYWANLVHSSYTQSGGTKTGHMFNPQDMSPLSGEALAETIRQLEMQNQFGVEEEFEGCCCGEEGINIKHFLDGSCAMTYNWGDNYKIHFSEDSKVGGLVGVAQTPGSTRVLDRETGKLVDCDAERCRYGERYEDIGWVNRAPYAAFAGGWAAAVAENAPPVQQRLAADFFAYASSFERSSIGIIPNATGPLSSFNGQDPFRTSHFELSKWLEKGYPEEGTINYRDTVAKSLNSENLVVDIRFPESDTIMGILDKKIHAYLQRVKNNEITDTDKASQRLAVAEEIANEWTSIVKEFDNDRSIGTISLLENYQRDLGVYIPPQDYNYIGNARWFGWSLAILVIVTSLGFSTWVTINRKKRVVKASQPIFLQLICVGTLLMASSIFPLGIDDEIASQRGCNVSCMAIPWLFGCGFSCVFAALFAKTQRVIQVFKAPNFTRITVTVQDVIKPFVALLMINIALLLAWTLADPYIFVRINTSPISSYGSCQSEGDGVTATVLVSIFAAVNIFTLIAANIQAFRARQISDEFSESKWIGICLASILQAIIIAVPVAVVTRDQPTVFNILISAFLFIISMTVQATIFIPKYMLLRKKAKAKLRGQESGSLGSSSGISGIRITRGFQTPAQKLQEKQQKEKMLALQAILNEKGLDVTTIFEEVGIDVSETNKDDAEGE